MKKEFSASWKSSKQPRKQRKYRANAPLHLKRKLISANLSKELRKKYSKRNIPIRTGDVVKIMRGKFKKKQGKITEIRLKNQRIIVEGIQVKKQDGSKVNVKLQPSNLQIIELNMEDRKRERALGKSIKSVETKTKDNKEESKKTLNKEK